MARNATNQNPGRAARLIRHLVPSRRKMVLLVATEIGLSLLGLPLGVHLALGGALHLLIELLRLAL